MIDPLSMHIPLSSPQTAAPQHPTRYLLKPSPDHPNDYIFEVDYSSASHFMVCPRQGENIMVRHREARKEKSAQNFGSLFHKLEEKRVLVGWTPELDQVHLETIADHFVKYPCPPEDHRTAAMMTHVLEGYKRTYLHDGMDKKVFCMDEHPFVERPFKIPLMTIEVNATLPYDEGLLVSTSFESRRLRVRNIHVVYVGKIDSLFIDEGKMFWVRDLKTSSRGGSEFSEAFRLSLQTRGYAWAAQKILGKPVVGLMLDAVIVRAITKTGKGVEYNRMSYFYTPDLIDEWEDDMKGHITNFVSCLVRGFFPQVALSFKSPCPSCDFFENCTLPRHQRGADLASDVYRDVTWNPMLIE